MMQSFSVHFNVMSTLFNVIETVGRFQSSQLCAPEGFEISVFGRWTKSLCTTAVTKMALNTQ